MDPIFEERFKKAEIEEMVRNLIVEKLDNVEYDGTDWNLNVQFKCTRVIKIIGISTKMSSAKNRFTHKLYSVYADVFQPFLSKGISNTHKRTSKRNSRLPSSKNRVLDGVHFRSIQSWGIWNGLESV